MVSSAESLPAGERDDRGAPRAGSEPVPLRFAVTDAAAVRVETVDELSEALSRLGLSGPRPTLVLVGGADGLDAAQFEQLRPLVAGTLVPAVADVRGAIIDGGTDSGVMRLMGEAVATAGGDVPLIGVATAATVTLPGGPSEDEGTRLEPHHSHFVLVPGEQWGDESEWISRTATILAGPFGSVTVLLNGGETAWLDVESSVAAGRQVLVLEGSGRAADEIAAELRSWDRGARAERLAASGLVASVPLEAGGNTLAAAIGARLGKNRP